MQAMLRASNVSSGSVQLPKYQILMELGKGGMGQVHLAMSRGPRGFVKLVVLKSLKAELRGDEATSRLFHQEARISARLAHPNLVQTYEIIEEDGAPTMVLEYVEGQTLATILEEPAQNLSRELHLAVLTKVLSGLHAAHELHDFDGIPLSLVHRDISPQNVMLQYDGQVKVLDFGIAKAARSNIATETGILKGKIRYMAPEQLPGDAQDRRVDVFAVGVMMWEALAGARFWGDLDDGKIMRGLLNEQIPRLPHVESIPKELVEICYRAIEVNPDRRYATALDFLRDLEGYLQRQGMLCSPEQLGAYLVEHFEADRQYKQQVINAHIEAVELSQHPPPPDRSVEKTAVVGNVARFQAKRASQEQRRLLGYRGWKWTLSIVSVAGAIGLAWWWFRLHPTQSIVPEPTTDRRPAEAVALHCNGNAKSCGGRCVTLDRPEFGCGTGGCQLCDISNATPRCNQHNECDIAVCYQAFDDCDGNRQNGCETNTRIDPDNCGGCGHRCPDLPHAQRGCGDACTIWRCQSGYRDCNGVVSDGCEVAVLKDRRNCGHCGVTCPQSSTCRQGKCEP